MNKIDSMVVNDSGFAFDPFTGETYTVNDGGTQILHYLRSGLDIPEIAEKFAEDFDIAFGEVYTDLLEFRNQLRIYGLMG